MKTKTFRYSSLYILLFGLVCFTEIQAQDQIRCMFYNVENLFDILDDTLKLDNEFTPEGDKNWTAYRYNQKLKALYQVIVAAGESKPPDLIGFAEVENRQVLNDLLQKTPLNRFGYQIVHYESPDIRGIDAALIYRRKNLKLISSQALPVINAENRRWKTRDIVYTRFLVAKHDTLSVFINHWPSRLGGEKKSEPKRMLAAHTLRTAIDSLFNQAPCSHILIMGDFNDEPANNSLVLGLGATNQMPQQIVCQQLYNLSGILHTKCQCGTYRYKAEWNMLDQVIVSGSLLLPSSLQVKGDVHILKNEFLLEDDTKYGGKKVHRTYSGPRYLGGYSDHLPVYIDLQITR